MLSNYAYIGLYLIIAVLFTMVMITIPIILRFIRIVPHKPNVTKTATFECGMETIGKTWVRFNFRYYFFALMFITLDVMVIFIYPWAVGLRQLGWGALVAMVIFIFILMVALLHAWNKKVLVWK
ncbi:NADH-quinone oxidoreductase subunit A [Chloroflexota bacterium]